ncbi:hypothetical protein NUW54_g3800 [Trametes sanguinea]|uniref:Uncharacterized protein n=1 Tax=Trametes sanguinea TaxID=158606 RepID=A0ACC1PZR8_9APHY|nr:hypothetical protein NUW54_g3800 [Trametes sanguinea]
MDPELAAAILASGANDAEPEPDVALTRAYFDVGVTNTLKDFLKSDLPPDHTYTVGEAVVSGDGVSVRYYIPAADGSPATYPVLVNIHGGGWSVGSIELDDYVLRQLCVKLSLSIVNIEYRLAPEHPFPAAVDDCLAALRWTVDNTSILKADLGKGFIVGGHSAGGNLSAVLSHILRDDPYFEGRRLTGQLLRDPFVCHPDAYPESLKSSFRSMEDNKDVPPVTRPVLDQLFGWYNAPPHDPRFSPLLYPSHEGLPRAYIQAMELDPLRDDAVVYARVLREVGVEVKFDLYVTSVLRDGKTGCADIASPRYPGVSHGFHYNWPGIKAAAKVRADLVDGIKWLLKDQKQ